MNQITVSWRWQEGDAELPEDFLHLRDFLTSMPVPDKIVLVQWGMPNAGTSDTRENGAPNANIHADNRETASGGTGKQRSRQNSS